MEEKLLKIQSQINIAVGMITVASMSIKEVYDAKELLIDASIKLDDVFEEL